MRALLLIVTLLVAAPAASVARAQRRAAPDPLALPSGPLACRSPTPAAEDSADVIVEIVERASAETIRGLLVAFDSTGRARYAMLQTALMEDSLHHAIETLAIRLAGRPVGGRVRVFDGVAVETPGMDSLSAGELRRAATLAAWIWAHRCAAPGGAAPPVRSPQPPTR